MADTTKEVVAGLRKEPAGIVSRSGGGKNTQDRQYSSESRMTGTSGEAMEGEGQSAFKTTMNWSPTKRSGQKRNIDVVDTNEESATTSSGEDEEEGKQEERRERRAEEEEGITLGRLVTEHGALYDDRVVWIKLEGIEGGNIGITCIYAPNIPTDRRHLWHIMVDALPKDYEWIIGGDFNMTKRPQNKSNDCGRGISDLERYTWNELLNAFQVQDSFIHQGGPRFSWNNR